MPQKLSPRLQQRQKEIKETEQSKVRASAAFKNMSKRDKVRSREAGTTDLNSNLSDTEFPKTVGGRRGVKSQAAKPGSFTVYKGGDIHRSKK